MSRSPDQDLIEGLLARDEESLRRTISLYGGRVYAMARRVVVDPGLAEEVTQDSFLALWRRPGAFDPDRGSLEAFLAGMARNKAIDVVRREEVRRRSRDELIAEAESDLRITTTPGEADRMIESRDVIGSLKRLSDAQRESIVLAYFGGRTYREVAQELGIPEGTAKTRLRDGLLKLRELMADTEDAPHHDGS
ncbi:MAG: sigma-70 family RNA polymerase sigma factor [Actinomycetota bacterium]